MSQSTEEFRQQFNKGLDDLRQLRDEIHVKLHLAGMDAKSRWEALEPRLAEAETRVIEATEVATDAARAAIVDAVKAFRSFRDSLSSDDKQPK